MNAGFRFLECEQGTPSWLAARAGLCTASKFADAISTVNGLTAQQQAFVDGVLAGQDKKVAAEQAGYKNAPTAAGISKALQGQDPAEPSDTALRYAADTAIELVSGQPFGEPAKTWLLERGHAMERQARMVYEARTGAFVTEAGLCVLDNAPYAYSTDGLVDEDGLIEVKSPIDGKKIIGMWQHVDVTEYVHQCQGGLWITNRKWCDLIMYCPDLANCGKDLFVHRIHRDDAFIDDMVLRLSKFWKLVEGYHAVLTGAAVADVPAPADFSVTPVPRAGSRLASILGGGAA